MVDINPFKRKICIVDDDPAIREIYRIGLEKGGFDVITASDGEEGLSIIKKERPDLALVDINMPKKDGIELIKDIRADKDISRTKLIMFTNFDDMDTIEKVGKYDTHFYIVKASATPQKVADMVKEALSE